MAHLRHCHGRANRCRILSRSLGFTLVELMITVAIVGTLSALAVTSMRLYLNHAKSAEALEAVGAIGRAVVARHAIWDHSTDDVTVTGSTSSNSQGNGKGNSNGKGNGPGGGATVVHGASNGLCDDAQPVPASMTSIKGKKYQASTRFGYDYQTGDDTTGWRCLRFYLNHPQHYQLAYQMGGPPVSVTLPHGGSPPGLSTNAKWSASARGDVDGDGRYSWFILEGYVKNDQVVLATGVTIQDQEE